MQSKWIKREIPEFDLVAFSIAVGKQWKQILICALAGICIFIGYTYKTAVKEFEIQQYSIQKENQKEETKEKLFQQLTDLEQKQVLQAFELNKEITEYQDILDHSVYLNLDPKKVDQVSLLYAVDGTTKEKRDKLVATYINYVQNGGLSKALSSLSDSSYKEEDLIDLISAEQEIIEDSGTQMYQENTTRTGILSIRILGKNRQMVENLSDLTKQILSDKNKEINKKIGRHNLELLECQTDIQAIPEITDRKHTLVYNMFIDINSFKAYYDAFRDVQKIAYETLLSEAGLKDSASDTDTTKSVHVVQSPALTQYMTPKNLFIGFFAGAIVFCIVFAFIYIFRDTVKSEKEMKNCFTFPIYGLIHLKLYIEQSKNKKKKYEHEIDIILHRIKMKCKKENLSKIYLTTCYAVTDVEKECIEEMMKQLKSWGIELIFCEKITEAVTQWDALNEVKNTIVLYKIGTTTHSMIREEHAFYMDNDVEILGAIAVKK